jgi:U3 small nucleolar RNA-associated protein MPP10
MKYDSLQGLDDEEDEDDEEDYFDFAERELYNSDDEDGENELNGANAKFSDFFGGKDRSRARIESGKKIKRKDDSQKNKSSFDKNVRFSIDKKLNKESDNEDEDEEEEDNDEDDDDYDEEDENEDFVDDYDEGSENNDYDDLDKERGNHAIKESKLIADRKKLKSQLAELEASLIGPKSWELKGEVKGGERPENSLLEISVDVDR